MEPVVSVAVTVTFLRNDAPPAGPAPVFRDGDGVVRVAKCSVPFYRYLYGTVGADYLWWLRRTVPDADMAMLLAHPAVSTHVLMRGGEPAGFYELDARPWPDVNLSYFGLMPHVIGGRTSGSGGTGYALLHHALTTAWSMRRLAPGPRGVTVNTCTADHPRALPTYLRAGFRIMRSVPERWDVPVRLGIRIPEQLRRA